MGADGVHERFVDLQRVQRQALQILQARIAGAEIVDGHRVAGTAQMGDGGACRIDVHQAAFGRLHPQLAAVYPGAAQRLRQHALHAAALDVVGGDIDGHVQRWIGGQGGAEFAEDFGHHQIGDRQDQAALFGQGDEGVRWHQHAVGLLPAHQRFGTDTGTAIERNDRLVVHDELAALHGDSQPRQWRQPPPRDPQHCTDQQQCHGDANRHQLPPRRRQWAAQIGHRLGDHRGPIATTVAPEQHLRQHEIAWLALGRGVDQQVFGGGAGTAENLSVRRADRQLQARRNIDVGQRVGVDQDVVFAQLQRHQRTLRIGQWQQPRGHRDAALDHEIGRALRNGVAQLAP